MVLVVAQIEGFQVDTTFHIDDVDLRAKVCLPNLCNCLCDLLVDLVESQLHGYVARIIDQRRLLFPEVRVHYPMI